MIKCFGIVIKTEVQFRSTTVTGFGRRSAFALAWNDTRRCIPGSTFCASNSVSQQSRFPNLTLSFLIVKIWPRSACASCSSSATISAPSSAAVNRHSPVTLRSIESEACAKGTAIMETAATNNMLLTCWVRIEREMTFSISSFTRGRRRFFINKSRTFFGASFDKSGSDNVFLFCLFRLPQL